MVERTFMISHSRMGKRADIYMHPHLGYEVDYFEDNKYLASESYAGKSLLYHEDAAENFVNGIKKI